MSIHAVDNIVEDQEAGVLIEMPGGRKEKEPEMEVIEEEPELEIIDDELDEDEEIDAELEELYAFDDEIIDEEEEPEE